MLAILTVDSIADNTNDDGFITLREAIIAANNDSVADATEGTQAGSGADTIVFDETLFIGGAVSISLLEGVLSITTDVTINGPGAELLTIDASMMDPTPESKANDPVFVGDSDGISIFSISQSTVSISGLALTGGDGDDGGAILSSGASLNLNNLVIYDNNANHGGALAVFAGTGDVITVANTVIGHEDPDFGNASYEYGGGIYINLSGDAEVMFDGLQILNNGSLYLGGGGIYLHNGFLVDAGEFTLQNSIVSGNTAGRILFESPTPSYGGGVFVKSSLNHLFTGGTTRFVRNSISNNTTIGSGGGLFFDMGDGRDPDPENASMGVEIRDTTIH